MGFVPSLPFPRGQDREILKMFNLWSNANKTGTSCCRYWRVVRYSWHTVVILSQRMVWNNLSDGWIMAQTGEELANASTNSSHSVGHLLCEVPFIPIITKCCTNSFKNGACLSTKTKSSSTSHPLWANCNRQVRVFLWDINTRSLYLVLEETVVRLSKFLIKLCPKTSLQYLSSTFFWLGYLEN